MHHALRAICALPLLALLACSPTSEPRPADPADPADPAPAEISPEPEGTGARVLVGGQNTWPPSGASCDRYVACCDAARASSPSVDLFCRLGVADEGFDCTSGIASVRRYVAELGATPPPACGQ